MAKRKRAVHERTEDWAQLRLLLQWPEQVVYEPIRFRHWRLYGERGPTGTPISVWVYDGALRLEYQTVLLSMYSVVLEADGEHSARSSTHDWLKPASGPRSWRSSTSGQTSGCSACGCPRMRHASPKRQPGHDNCCSQP